MVVLNPDVESGLLKIGEVARLTGLSQRTIRYYEHMSLVSAYKRSDNGFRLYSPYELEQLQLAKLLRPMNLSMDEMREILSAARTTGVDSGQDGTAATKSTHECLGLAREHVDQLERRAVAAREAYARLRIRLEEPIKR